MNRSRQIMAVSLVLALAFIVRWVNLTAPSLWTDELATCWVASAPSYSECVARAVATQGQSPLYYCCIKALFGVLPRSELSMRLPSVFFSLTSTFLVWSLAKRLFKNDVAAITAAFIFALNETQIHQAQEARPYAMGTLFALASQWLFLNLIEAFATKRREERRGEERPHQPWRNSRGALTAIFYSAASILMLYCHYLNASVLLAQNTFVLTTLAIKWRTNHRFLAFWAATQTVVFGGVILMATQWKAMLSGREKWDWVGRVGFLDALKIQFSLLDSWIVAGVAVVILCVWKAGGSLASESFKNKRKEFLFLGLWLIAPLTLSVAASRTLDVSLISRRYLALSTVPFCVLTGRCLIPFKSNRLNALTLGIFIITYSTMIFLPDLQRHGGFAFRVQDDWRSALGRVSREFRGGDAVLLRAGFVKENWLPTSDDPIIHAYCRCPFDSFYVKKWGDKTMPVQNLTYTFNEEAFGPYFERILDELRDHDRVWVVGVNPPNTNYPIARTPLLLESRGWKRVETNHYDGVFLCLLENPKP